MVSQLSRRSFLKAAGIAMAAAYAGSAMANEAGAGAQQGGERPQGVSEMRVDEDGNRIVVDSGGTEVVCPAEIQTVMTFGSCGVINTLIETLGCGWMLANNMSPRFANGGWEYQYLFASQMADEPQLENAAGEIDIEGVIAAAPDLCIVMQPATAQTLRDSGLNTLYVGFGNGRDASSIKNAMIILGQALDAVEEAEAYNRYLDDMVAKIEDVVSAVPEDERLKVLYGNVLQYVNPHILSEWFIPAAGGVSVTSDIHDQNSASFSAEDVLAWDPDVIIMITDISDELKADEQLAGVAAIQNDRLYTLPTVGHFITGSTEIAYGILYLANIFYPDLYPVEELREDMRYFYQTFFDYEMSDEELDALINR